MTVKHDIDWRFQDGQVRIIARVGLAGLKMLEKQLPVAIAILELEEAKNAPTPSPQEVQ